MDNHSMAAILPTDGTTFPSWMMAGQHGRLPYYVITAVVLLIAYFWRNRTDDKIAVPFYKASLTKWIFDAETLIRDSYGKFQDSVYQIKATEGRQVMVPPTLLAEMKVLPDDVLSQTEALAEASYFFDTQDDKRALLLTIRTVDANTLHGFHPGPQRRFV
jgi:hypothetical protein